MEFVILGVLIAAAGFFLVSKNKQSKISEQTATHKQYAAVRIEDCDFSCAVAFDQSSRIYLASEAPSLPLNGCDRTEKCRCRYVHYSDRRQNHDDRRNDSQVLRDTFVGNEKRISKKRGRRVDD
jgi:hypothetical protein